MSQQMVHKKILRKCGGALEHSLRRRFMEPFSTEEKINALEDIVTRTKTGRTWKKLDIKISNKPYIKKDKVKNPPKPNSTYKRRKCHQCDGIGSLANNCIKKEKINKILETKDHNDKEEESYSEKDIEESEKSESD
ncbi:hypothetical protein O181_079549 [Austropuccinia psidii MF-1]|uniref:Uncharacterized protein n=1 Tax=Austropuccinia psidii MF-1 TaxID=1389203 RepID=A0A9Q3FIP8_9BASI|nr:hypothetical protein [Austropuccinia psidii MF-1]